jgi:hypothetical protein
MKTHIIYFDHGYSSVACFGVPLSESELAVCFIVSTDGIPSGN